MGSSFCQCKTICQKKREENLSSSNLSTTYNYNMKRTRNKLVNTLFCNRSSETLNSIYKKNCAEKIIRTYLKFKQKKLKKVNNENKNNDKMDKKEENKSNSKDAIDAYDNLEKYSINHPFYIDKIHKSKTIYKKFNIPKINNLPSLEILNKSSSATDIFYKEKKKFRKRKNK